MLPAVDERRWLLPTPLGGDSPAEPAGDPGGELPCELLAILRRRGLLTASAVRRLLEPEAAPDPQAHFAGLAVAVERLVRCNWPQVAIKAFHVPFDGTLTADKPLEATCNAYLLARA
ncbi:hypothetical protein [Synechococcus sp. BA-132 BA5]|uniref:hypothetical protein n=1 Tax=Synechococcus sp. BA-132 BA5 TaxID=3110252 RepID=UPI002B21B457|nr:hypothetical protein [Synechococcus sp. BA-132 BA5]MEA5417138.1 hypothetical protein [Synechococcus sp. BA-132 BA5]